MKSHPYKNCDLDKSVVREKKMFSRLQIFKKRHIMILSEKLHLITSQLLYQYIISLNLYELVNLNFSTVD